MGPVMIFMLLYSLPVYSLPPPVYSLSCSQNYLLNNQVQLMNQPASILGMNVIL